MSGQTQPELIPLPPADPDRQQHIARRAAVHAADRVAAEHPHELDELMPKLAGRTIAHNPTARAELLLLLDALGLTRKESDRA